MIGDGVFQTPSHGRRDGWKHLSLRPCGSDPVGGWKACPDAVSQQHSCHRAVMANQGSPVAKMIEPVISCSKSHTSIWKRKVDLMELLNVEMP